MQITNNTIPVNPNGSLQTTHSNYAITDTLKKLCQLICDIVLLPLNLLNQLFRGTPSQTPPTPLPAPTFLQKAEQQIKKIPAQVQAHKREITALVTAGVTALSLYYYFVSLIAVKEAPSSINPNLMLQIGAGVTAILGVCLIYKKSPSCCPRSPMNYKFTEPVQPRTTKALVGRTDTTTETEVLPPITKEQINSCKAALSEITMSEEQRTGYTKLAKKTFEQLRLAAQIKDTVITKEAFFEAFLLSDETPISSVCEIFQKVAFHTINESLLIEAGAVMFFDAGVKIPPSTTLAQGGFRIDGYHDEDPVATKTKSFVDRAKGSKAFNPTDLNLNAAKKQIDNSVASIPAALSKRYYELANEEIDSNVESLGEFVNLTWYKDQLIPFETILDNTKVIKEVKNLSEKISEEDFMNNQKNYLDLLQSLTVLVKHQEFLSYTASTDLGQAL